MERQTMHQDLQNRLESQKNTMISIFVAIGIQIKKQNPALFDNTQINSRSMAADFVQALYPAKNRDTIIALLKERITNFRYFNEGYFDNISRGLFDPKEQILFWDIAIDSIGIKKKSFSSIIAERFHVMAQQYKIGNVLIHADKPFPFTEIIDRYLNEKQKGLTLEEKIESIPLEKRILVYDDLAVELGFKSGFHLLYTIIYVPEFMNLYSTEFYMKELERSSASSMTQTQTQLFLEKVMGRKPTP